MIMGRENEMVKNEFSPEDIKAFTPSEKVGLLACVNPEGLPHVALITSMQAKEPERTHCGGICNRGEQEIHPTEP